MFQVDDQDSDAGSGFLFSDGYLSHFDFRGKLKIILDLINDTSEEDVFGESVVKWRISDEGRKLVKAIAIKQYLEAEEKQTVDESDTKSIYRGMITKYLEFCLKHEEFIMKSDNSADIRRLGLRNLNSPENIKLLYGICRVHDSGVATYMGFDPDDPYPNKDNDRGEFLITSEEAAINSIAHCNIVVTPMVDEYKTIYFISPHHIIGNLPDDYNIIVRK